MSKIAGPGPNLHNLASSDRSIQLTKSVARSSRTDLAAAKIAGMQEPPQSYHTAKIVIDGRTIECSSAKTRRLLQDAATIGDDPTAAQHFSIGRLMLIEDACQLHSLGRHQRLVKLANDRLKRSAPRSKPSAKPGSDDHARPSQRVTRDSVRSFSSTLAIGTGNGRD